MTSNVISLERSPTLSDWIAPIPLTQDPTLEIPYPIDALPTLIRQAVTTYQHYGQQPLSLIACSALANVSLALAKRWRMLLVIAC